MVKVNAAVASVASVLSSFPKLVTACWNLGARYGGEIGVRYGGQIGVRLVSDAVVR